MPSRASSSALPSLRIASAETSAEAPSEPRLTDPLTDSPPPTTPRNSANNVLSAVPSFCSGCGIASTRQPSFNMSPVKRTGEASAALSGRSALPTSARILSKVPSSAILLGRGVVLVVEQTVQSGIDAIDDQVLADVTELAVAGSRIT